MVGTTGMLSTFTDHITNGQWSPTEGSQPSTNRFKKKYTLCHQKKTELKNFSWKNEAAHNQVKSLYILSLINEYLARISVREESCILP